MKQIFFILTCFLASSMISCCFVSAQPPEPFSNELVFENVLHKNDLKQFKRAAFPADGTRFLISDDYTFICLWKEPFVEPSLNLPIENYSSRSAMLFFGDKQAVFFAATNGTVQIWDPELKSNKFNYTFIEPARQVAITADGRFIAADGALYDRQEKSLVGRSVAHAFYTGAHFGGGNLLITSGYHDHGVAVRNIHSGEFEFRRSPHPVTGSAISPDEKYIVATSNKGRCYLWRWPEQEPTALVVSREDIRSVKFSPDSRWFVVFGTEFTHIFQCEPPIQMARLRPEVALDSLEVASANLIAMGDKNGTVNIYDVSAQRMIGKQKVCEASVRHLKLIPEKGLLWAGGCCMGKEKEEKGEIALYGVKGLAPFIEPKRTDK